MKIYIALVEDDSADTEVHTFLTKTDAVDFCMTKAAEYAHLESDIENHTYPDEILCLHYHPEGSKITVSEHELMVPDNMFVCSGTKVGRIDPTKKRNE